MRSNMQQKSKTANMCKYKCQLECSQWPHNVLLADTVNSETGLDKLAHQHERC